MTKESGALAFILLLDTSITVLYLILSVKSIRRGDGERIAIPVVLIGFIFPPVLWGVIAWKIISQRIRLPRLATLIASIILASGVFYFHEMLVGASLHMMESSNYLGYVGAFSWLVSPTLLLVFYPLLLRAERDREKAREAQAS